MIVIILLIKIYNDNFVFFEVFFFFLILGGEILFVFKRFK